MKTIIKIPVYVEITSSQNDRKEVTKAVRDFIQPEILDTLKNRFDLSYLSSSQRRSIKAILGDSPSLRFVSASQILRTGVFPDPLNNKKPWE